jgi:hypothetical protein
MTSVSLLVRSLSAKAQSLTSPDGKWIVYVKPVTGGSIGTGADDYQPSEFSQVDSNGSDVHEKNSRWTLPNPLIEGSFRVMGAAVYWYSFRKACRAASRLGIGVNVRSELIGFRTLLSIQCRLA